MSNQPYKCLLKNAMSVLLIFSLTGCKKYLEAIPDKSLAIPKELKELQGLLDYEEMNTSFPIGAGLSVDDLYFTSPDYNSIFFIDDRLTYVWDPATDFSKDWSKAYQRIFKSNVVLQTLPEIEGSANSIEEKNKLWASALFYRALYFYDLAQAFAPALSPETADLGYGIPLKESANVDDVTVRSTVAQTYTKIIDEVKMALPHLPAVAEYKTRPGKASAYALLARVYLVNRDYINAGIYADSSLKLVSGLMDYNDPIEVNLSSNNPFKRLNKEVIFHGVTRGVPELLKSKVDSLLVNTFSQDDLRRTAFFRINADGTASFKGSYDGTASTTLFAGIAVDEIFLIRAECEARQGRVDEAMADLNDLLRTRWRSGTFVPYTASNAKDALDQILIERRKELCFRATLRWSDLRRLNFEADRAVTLKRYLDGKIYTLLPKDKLYTFLIPQSVINNSGIQQNPR